MIYQWNLNLSSASSVIICICYWKLTSSLQLYSLYQISSLSQDSICLISIYILSQALLHKVLSKISTSKCWELCNLRFWLSLACICFPQAVIYCRWKEGEDSLWACTRFYLCYRENLTIFWSNLLRSCKRADFGLLVCQASKHIIFTFCA